LPAPGGFVKKAITTRQTQPQPRRNQQAGINRTRIERSKFSVAAEPSATRKKGWARPHPGAKAQGANGKPLFAPQRKQQWKSLRDRRSPATAGKGKPRPVYGNFRARTRESVGFRESPNDECSFLPGRHPAVRGFFLFSAPPPLLYLVVTMICKPTVEMKIAARRVDSAFPSVTASVSSGSLASPIENQIELGSAPTRA